MPQTVYDPDNKHQDIFAYTDKHAGRTPATLVVAAADSRNKDRADYICDGEADQFTINAAINSLPMSGGSVLLLEGTYDLDLYGATLSGSQYRIIEIARANVTLRGQGRSTRLRLADDISAVGYGYQMLSVRAAGFSLENLVLDGNIAANSDGSVEGLRGNIFSERLSIRHCEFRDLVYAGINCQANYGHISHNFFTGCGYGLFLSGGSATVSNNNFIENGDGINIQSGSFIISGNRFYDNTARGIYAYSAFRNQISNNDLVGQPVGMHLKDCVNCMIRDNLVWRDAFAAAYANGEYSLYLEGCNRVMAVGNWLCKKAVVSSGSSNVMTAFSGGDWNLSV